MNFAKIMGAFLLTDELIYVSITAEHGAFCNSTHDFVILLNIKFCSPSQFVLHSNGKRRARGCQNGASYWGQFGWTPGSNPKMAPIETSTPIATRRLYTSLAYLAPFGAIHDIFTDRLTHTILVTIGETLSAFCPRIKPVGA